MRYVQLQHILSDLNALQEFATFIGTCLAGDTGVTKAMDCFSERQGLDRSLEIAADLYNLDSDSQNGSSSPSVSPAAAAYVAYLTNLAQKASNPEDQSGSQHACLRSVITTGLVTNILTSLPILLARCCVASYMKCEWENSLPYHLLPVNMMQNSR